MRFIVIAIAAAAFLLVPATTPAKAFCGTSLTTAQAASIDLSAAKKKKAAKKTAKKKKEKVEYMRSAAPPAK